MNNAGILRLGSIETAPMEQYDLVMNTNVRLVVPIMPDRVTAVSDNMTQVSDIMTQVSDNMTQVSDNMTHV